MNALTTIDATSLTMSSREIAELTLKNHKDVMRDIRVMLDGLEIQSAQFCADYKDARGRVQKELRLPKRETLILVSGYNVQMRAKIIDRWQELEAQTASPQFQIPQTMGEALRLAADLSEQNAKMAERIEEDRPKVEFCETVAASGKELTVAEAAQLLGTGEKRLFAMLREKGYLRKNGTAPKQQYIERGLMAMKLSDYRDGRGYAYTNVQAMITGKGLQYFQRRYFSQGTVQLALRLPSTPMGTIKDGSTSDRILKLMLKEPMRCFSESEIVDLIQSGRGAVSFSLANLRNRGRVESIPAPNAPNPRHLRWRLMNHSGMH